MRDWELPPVDVRIGLTQTPKELEVQLEDDADAGALRSQVDEALAAGTTLWLTDRKGRQVGVPAAKLAYVEVGTNGGDRRIGFGG